MKKILIVSNYFYPENTPRAFRTTELAKGFLKKGYIVYVVVPTKECYNKNRISNINYLNTDKIDVRTNKVIEVTAPVAISGIRKKINRIINYFIPRDPFRLFDPKIFRTLKQFDDNIDIIISISQPLYVHFCVVLASLFNKKIRKAVSFADFSDPPFQGNYIKNVFPLYSLWGYLISPFFDYFMIPIPEVLKVYKYYKCKSNIKIIPQAFNLEDYSFADNRKINANKQVIFAYAGQFYRNLREPQYFLESILKLTDFDFVFKIYINSKDKYFADILNFYAAKSNGKIKICSPLPRYELLQELSNCDFVVNIGNEDSKMSPSKLIDYALINLPIYSFNKKTYDEETFKKFLRKDFTESLKIDISQYDINIVTNKIENLSYEKR